MNWVKGIPPRYMRDHLGMHRGVDRLGLKRGICWNCRHLRKFNGDLADWVCERKGSVVIDTRRRECDDMWEERE